MLIESGGSGIATFSDETSTDTRRTDNCKVVIYAQVVRERTVDWFYDLVRLWPDIPGELKSSVIVDHLHNLPRDLVDRVWRGLRLVRIHIADPRPYRSEVDRIYREILGCTIPWAAMSEGARRGDPLSRLVLDHWERAVASEVLLDSPSYRVGYSFSAATNFYQDPTVRLGSSRRNDGLEADLLRLRRKRKSVTTRAVELAAKESPVFSSALDSLDDPLPDEYRERRFVDYREYVHRTVASALRERHAFDRGDDELLGFVQKKRDAMIGRWSVDPDYSIESPTLPLETFDSARVLHGQAADVAARIAAVIYESEALMSVVRRFEYVAYNGARVSEEGAEEEMKRRPVNGRDHR